MFQRYHNPERISDTWSSVRHTNCNSEKREYDGRLHVSQEKRSGHLAAQFRHLRCLTLQFPIAMCEQDCMIAALRNKSKVNDVISTA